MPVQPSSLLGFEPAIRIAAFAGVFAMMALWELLAPRRALMIGRRSRWPSNLGIVALDTLLVRLLFPTAAVGTALLGEAAGWGLLPRLGISGWPAVAVAVMALDLAVYLQHVLFHAVPALWRLHRMHHADLDFDVTTGARFHPIEIVLSMVWKLAIVVALGAPALAVLGFEVLLNATAMFNHGNVRIPKHLDRWLRWLVVTPDMHRVHHSIVSAETNSNFGFNLPWWDRLLGTYREAPAAGHESMTIGLEQFRDPGELRLDRMLLQPFRELARGREAGGGRSAGGKTSEGRWIEVDELAARLRDGGSICVVDVRSHAEFDGPLGHIPGARLVPLDTLAERTAELREIPTATIVVVCHTDKRSTRAAAILQAAGLANVRVLRGGMERWNARTSRVPPADDSGGSLTGQGCSS
jgi:sterol desaturase/sphingolipid hydroxylase (fatty acid hydroxylase superfamily)/rhodanese-related sulfurtransferase